MKSVIALSLGMMMKTMIIKKQMKIMFDYWYDWLWLDKQYVARAKS